MSGSVRCAFIVETDLMYVCVCVCVWVGRADETVSVLLFLSGSALMAGPTGWLPAICPGILPCMPSPYSSVEVSESVLMPVCVCVCVRTCVCVSVCYCVVYVFFASVPSVLIKELSQALLNIHIHSFLDCYFVLSLSHMRAHARTHTHTHTHTCWTCINPSYRCLLACTGTPTTKGYARMWMCVFVKIERCV